jgi:site-specific DNA recombinase
MVKRSKRFAAVYTRISGQSDDKRASLETQAERAKALAEAQGYTVRREDIFEDRWTGYELGRPALARLREQVRGGLYEAVVFYAVDRLTRNQAHIYILLDECERAGAKLIGVEDSIENTAEGKLILSIKTFLAEVEREKIKDRCMRGKRRMLDEGKILGTGTPRFGYKFDKDSHRLVRDEKTAPIVARIFDLMGNQGLSLRQTLIRLVDDGVPPPGARRRNGHGKSGLWMVSTLSKLVKDETYLGVVVWGKTKTTGERRNGKLVQVPVPEDQWKRMPPGCVDVFIDPATWRAANERLASRNGDRARNEKSPRLLRGMVICKRCGARMIAVSSKSPTTQRVHRYYGCSAGKSRSSAVPKERGVSCGARMTPAPYVDDAVWAQVVSMRDNPAEFRRRYEAALAQAEDTPLRGDLEAVEREVAKKDGLKKRLQLKWSEALDERDAEFAAIVEAELKSCMAEAKKLRGEAERLRGEILILEDVASSIRNIEAKVAKCQKAMLTEASFDQRRDLLEALDVRVEAEGKDFRVSITPFAVPTPCSSGERRTCKPLRVDISPALASV